jgi:hypothetical protein
LTAFHPQTDVQIERQDQTMEQYLRAYSNYEQDNWVQQLPLAAFGYHDSVHHSTRMMPFCANYHYHPPMQFKPLKASTDMKSDILADTTVLGMEDTHQLHWEGLLETLVRQAEYAGGMDVTFEVRNKVWLST